MAVTPDSYIKLLKVPIELDNKNQLTFSNVNAQYAYFNGLQNAIVGDNFTYIRKDNIIRFPQHIDTLLGYNYVMYQNSNYTNKWFYAFITGMKYINDNMTEISIKTDVFQTWQFDLTYKRCFVEREHVNDDTIGLHTVPEQLETGDYVQNAVSTFAFHDYAFLIQVQKFWHTTNIPIATNLGRIAQAGGFYLCSTFQQVVDILIEYNDPDNGVSIDNITNIYIVPERCTSGTTDSNHRWSGQTAPVVETHTMNKISSLNGYTPKNKKLLTYPYVGLLMSNNNGSSNLLRLEEFSTSDCQFEIVSVPTVGASIKCAPKYYKNHGSGGYEEEKIIAGKFPTLSWSADAYTNWLTQNGVNLSVGFATDIGMTIGGILSGGVGTAVSGAMGIINRMAQIEQQKFAPNTAKGNTNAGDVATANYTNDIYFYMLSIKYEYAKMIDDFFTMYGYKVNSVKVPNVTGRTNWNYVKTVDSIIIGDVPQEDLQEIKNMFDDGVTFWHNSNTFLDYSQSNTIV